MKKFPALMVCIAIFASSVTSILTNGTTEDRIGYAIGAGVLGLFAGLYLGVILIRIVPSNMMVFYKDGYFRCLTDDAARHFWVWDYNNLMQDNDGTRAPMLSYEKREIEKEMCIRPITPNPKVRELIYTVKLTAMGTTEDALAVQRLIKTRGSLKGWLKYHLYEFNEAMSSQLAQFYNPEDDTQQKQFEQMLAEYLSGVTRNSGVTFVSARFALP